MKLSEEKSGSVRIWAFTVSINSLVHRGRDKLFSVCKEENHSARKDGSTSLF